MNIFVPGTQESNPFLNEIVQFSEHKFICLNHRDYKSVHYEAVLLQWPELFFAWKNPSEDEALELERILNFWQREKKVFYIVHNLRPHLKNPIIEIFYQRIEILSDVMIHLGEFSLQYFRSLYPNKVHVIMGHPLYLSSYKIYDKLVAREFLGISERAQVVIAPGQIRNSSERRLVLNAFKRIPFDNKVLLVPKMKKRFVDIEFRGKYYLKKKFNFLNILENLNDHLYNKKRYVFSYCHISDEELSLWMSASDIVFVPRIDTLNSGILFLGLTFKKIVVGPGIGNIKEVLEKINYPIFDPNDQNSVNMALRDAFNVSYEKDRIRREKFIHSLGPQIIAHKLDKILR